MNIKKQDLHDSKTDIRTTRDVIKRIYHLNISDKRWNSKELLAIKSTLQESINYVNIYLLIWELSYLPKYLKVTS